MFLTYFSCSPPRYLTSEPMRSSPVCSVGSGRAPSGGQLQAHFISAETPEGGRGLPQRLSAHAGPGGLGFTGPTGTPTSLGQSPGRAALQKEELTFTFMVPLTDGRKLKLAPSLRLPGLNRLSLWAVGCPGNDRTHRSLRLCSRQQTKLGPRSSTA